MQDNNLEPLYIKVKEMDNTAIIVNDGGLKEGTVFKCGLELKNKVPQGHKVALEDIEKDGEIIRYGEVIGYAKNRIEKGSWIRDAVMNLPIPPELSTLKEYGTAKPNGPLEEEYTFLGYRNADGSVGIKNILGITTSVQCVVGVLDYAVQKIKEELLSKYPNVEDVIAINHNYGCGVAINAGDANIPIRTIQNLAKHPSFGGEIMVVGLGCEKLQPSRLNNREDNDNIVMLQDQNGFTNMIQSIMSMAEERLEKLNQREREEFPLSELVVGMQCGGSDAFSGVTANPAVGYATDLLVKAGATVLFSEVTEVRDAVHLLTQRAESREVTDTLVREMDWYDKYLNKGDVDRSANPSPGNKKGGLSNVVEKSLGSVIKSGTSPITDVLSPGERVRKKGLNFAATPASDFVCGTLQLAAGMHLQVFTTGRGTPYNLSMAPVLKVSTRNELKKQWSDLIDINAGTIATGKATIEDVGWEIFHDIIATASGTKTTCADKCGIQNDLALFNPAPVT
ncbi:galactarate dehydratase [Oceanobacillus locisalsi]|uniref:Galactarate dehydratase n=1 Tax=Oceanobacillus locisalsi TaxID=546107 RepID=A0ABW3NDB6_9BACI